MSQRLLFPPRALAILLAAGCTTVTKTVEVDTPCASGTMCTFAGSTRSGYNGDKLDRRASWLSLPVDLAFDCDGHAVIVDFNNYLIRRVNADDTLENVIGDGFPGDGDPRRATRPPRARLGSLLSSTTRQTCSLPRPQQRSPTSATAS